MAKFMSWIRLAAFFLLVHKSNAKIYDGALLENIDEMAGLIMVEYGLSMYSINSVVSQLIDSDANPHVSLLRTPEKYYNSSEYNDAKYKPESAREAWEAGGSTWPYDDWVRDSVTVDESGAKQFFDDWMEDYKSEDSHGCKSRSQSPMGCLAYIYWGNTKFMCPIDKTEACQAPSFLEIRHHIELHWSNSLTIDERIDLARKVMFTAESFQTLVWNLAALHNIIGIARSEIARRIPQVVKDFVATRDVKKIDQCQLVKDLIHLSIDIMMEAASIGMAIGGLPGVSKNTSQVAKKAKQWTEFSMGKAMQIAGMIRSWKGKGEHIDAAIKKAMARAGDSSHSSSYGSMPALELHMSKAKGLCGNAFSIPENDIGSQIDAVSRFSEDFMEETQAGLERQFKSLTTFQDDGSQLLETLMSLQYIRPSDISQNDYSESKSKLITAFDQLLISKVLAGNRCYMKCETRSGANPICGTGKEDLEKSRYCPDDLINNQNVGCQMACWPKQERWHREKSLFGADNLEKYGLSASQLANNSWAFYKGSGTLGFLLTDTIIDGEAQVKEADYKLAHIPVCMSNVPVIPGYKLGNKFPYSCGSYRNEESGLFVEAVNVHFAEERELLRNAFASLKRHLRDNVPEPLNQYSLLCNLNVRWPYKIKNKHYNPQTKKTETDRVHQLRAISKDPRCERVEQATQSLNEHEANKAFCSWDLVGAIIDDEKKKGLIAPVVKNTKAKCQDWMEKYGYNFDMKHLVESPAWNQTAWDLEKGSIEDRIDDMVKNAGEVDDNTSDDDENEELEDRDLVDQDFDDDGEMLFEEDLDDEEEE